MLVTQATEAQQRKNTFRSFPVFSPATLQWQRLMLSLQELSPALCHRILHAEKELSFLSHCAFLVVPFASGDLGSMGYLGSAVYPTKPAFSRMEEYFSVFLVKLVFWCFSMLHTVLKKIRIK